ncbi:hypothetical protein IKF89_03225 [Candidatus Saccharibacteria bacterium]|nr:hypothetical protein [Candidatus Saccharibacteria bacterium]
MVRSKNRSNFGLQKPRTPVSAYRYAVTSKNTITIVIVIAAILVFIAVICSVLLNPERQVKLKFEALATNYYENIFYTNLINSKNFSGSPQKSLEKYTETGLSPMTLRQLILHDADATKDTADYLLKYCDENETRVTFYPEPSYSKTAYHAEYTYSCNF